MIKNNFINYIEFKANDLKRIEEFYNTIFGWKFTYYWPEYLAFSECWIEWWFEKTQDKITNWVLVTLYNDNLENIKDRIIELWWKISQDIFSFPWGHRFHFLDPSWNELWIWSDK
jgi:uncharacterized protein